jgi:hypothetical protein
MTFKSFLLQISVRRTTKRSLIPGAKRTEWISERFKSMANHFSSVETPVTSLLLQRQGMNMDCSSSMPSAYKSIDTEQNASET